MRGKMLSIGDEVLLRELRKYGRLTGFVHNKSRYGYLVEVDGKVEQFSRDELQKSKRGMVNNPVGSNQWASS